MKTRQECIEILKAHESELRNKFGISYMRVFGSVARDEQHDGSDVDVCVVMNPDMLLHVRLKRFLEEQLNCAVDVVRLHKNMNETLKNEIDRDGIEIFA